MKIKVDQYIAGKLSTVVADAIVEAIKEQKMTNIFSLNDIKGSVLIGPMMAMGSPIANTYNYFVKLFDRIILISGQIVTMRMGMEDMAHRDISSVVFNALANMITQPRDMNSIYLDLSRDISKALDVPETVVTFSPFEEMKIDLFYTVSKEGKHTFDIDVNWNDEPLAEYTGYGHTLASVNPLTNGQISMPMHLIAKYSTLAKAPDFYITEDTHINPYASKFNPGYSTAMINNPNGPGGYAMTPNFNSQNHGGIGGLSPDDINNRF